ncbi:MAG: TraR/DksA C4-type zinc finger protein [bacterium]|nr:TraR/DksA C4-type zinc finger protein [bacterium]
MPDQVQLDRELRSSLMARGLKFLEDLRLSRTDARPTSREFEEWQDSDTGLKLLEMSSATIKQMMGALERFQHGGYGICNECGEEISEARLRALPFATRCTRCQNQYETPRHGILFA